MKKKMLYCALFICLLSIVSGLKLQADENSHSSLASDTEQQSDTMKNHSSTWFVIGVAALSFVGAYVLKREMKRVK